MTTKTHYDASYFDWQRPLGEFGGWANVTKFAAYVRPTDDVLDFGCGGGFLLRNLECRRRIGVEVNPAASRTAVSNGVECFARASDVPDACADVIISNNALEHTLHPLQELQALHAKVRSGGLIVFVVPCESITYAYAPGDVNHHLYSWSPMCIGNLFTEAGFHVLESKPYIHKWPELRGRPVYRYIARFGGRPAFEVACRIYGRLKRTWFQVRVIGRKP